MEDIIGISSDHAGFEMKEAIKAFLLSKSCKLTDLGTFNTESADYPDYGHVLAEALEKGDVKRGIALCGSGNGISMTLNKHAKVRAALCWNEEISKLAREHNDANVCTLPARFVDLETAKRIVDIFLNTPFEGGRHQRRVNKISCANK